MRRLGVPLVGIVVSAAIGVAAGTIGVGLDAGSPAFAASIVDLPVPAGSVAFGTALLVLSNGNFVVTDPEFQQGGIAAVGAVHLYNGATNQLISTLTGSKLNDRVGLNGVYEVGAGNFIVRSPSWDNGAAVDAGAVTWVNGATGLAGAVSPANSLVGSATDDAVGEGPKPLVLDNGNYFTLSRAWGAPASLGALTWSAGSQGTAGPISSANSLIGGHDEDFGNAAVYALENSNAVLATPYWDNGVTSNAGAATWINGATGRTGTITQSTSLYGTQPDDSVGGIVTALTNGNYVVSSPQWDNGLLPDVGSATWGNGATGTTGEVSTANSLVGQSDNDQIAAGGVKALTNGNYVVASLFWKNGAQANAGAATWASGSGPTSAFVTVANSIHGTVANDLAADVAPLDNGNYVVLGSQIDIDGRVDAGAATWASGSGPTAAAISAANSIVGSSAGDAVGLDAITLPNGNYVVRSNFQIAAAKVGGTTWASGTGPSIFAINASNSLVGSTAGDYQNVNVSPLANGNYVVWSRNWTNAGVGAAGAVTWGSGTSGVHGAISPANSLVGSTANDGVALDVQPLDNGNAIALWSFWNAPAAIDAGAATFLTGSGPTTGAVSAANSIVGSHADDRVGWSADELDDGNALIRSPFWDNGPTANTGVARWLSGNGPSAGPLSSANSLVGPAANAGIGDLVAYPLPGGGYVVRSKDIANGANPAAGAATYSEPGGLAGTLTATNTVFGVAANGGDDIQVARRYTAGDGVVVGRPADNKVAVIITADKTPPALATPANITVQAAPGAHSAVVSYPLPTATDVRSGPATVGCNPPSGSSFPVGATTVTCVATDGVGLTSSVTFTVTVVGAGDYVPLAPARLADTRDGFATVDGLNAGGGMLDTGSTLELQVAGRGGVAADASAATLNVTAVDAVAPGFATVWPCDEQRPNASNLNFATSATVPNAVLAKIGAGGKVCLFTSQPIHFVVDVNGYFPRSTSYRALNPGRILDTRDTGTTVDGAQHATGLAAADSTTTLQVTGRAGVPADATSVVLNVTTTESVADGYVTASPCDAPRPNASSVNGVAHATVANLVISKLSASGTVCLYSQSPTHLIADVNGYFAPGGSYAPIVPARLMDSRSKAPGTTVDGNNAGSGTIPLGTVTPLHVNSRGGVPDASTVVLNITVTEPAAPGYVTAYPCGPDPANTDPPNASNLNYATNQTVANGALVKVGAGGDVCLYNSQPTHLVVDVTGYFPT